jgi:hypothetical protein
VTTSGMTSLAGCAMPSQLPGGTASSSRPTIACGASVSSMSCRMPTGVVRGGQAGADVQELADAARAGQVADSPGQEGPLFPHPGDDRGEIADRLLGGFPVGREVVLPAQPVVIDAGLVRHRRA